MNIDKYFKDMWQLLDGAYEQPLRMFRNWQETWEKKKLGPTGNVMLHEKLKVKYVGLKLAMNEGYHRIFTVHEVQFVRESQRKYYRIVAVLKEFNTAMSGDNNNEDHYDFWDFCPEYDCFQLTMIFMPRKIMRWCSIRVVFVTAISRKKTWIWHVAAWWRRGGGGSMAAATERCWQLGGSAVAGAARWQQQRGKGSAFLAAAWRRRGGGFQGRKHGFGMSKGGGGH